MCDELELYVVHALSESERSAFEAHLTLCARCAEELPSLQEAAALMALALDEGRPPARLKMSVLSLTAMEAQEPAPAPVVALAARRRRLPALLAAGAIAASFALGATVAAPYLSSNSSAPAAPGVPPATTVMDVVRAAPDSATVEKKLASGGTVAVAYSLRLNKGVVSARGLHELSGKQVYQVWLQDAEGAMVPAGAFTRGKAALLVLEGDVATAQGLGLTVEPKPGATEPSALPLVLMSL